MPIYMDVHLVPGARAIEVAQAHHLDLVHQTEFECNCMTYWVDEVKQTVFCLIEAPNKEAVISMHNKSHGLIPHRIIEVQSSLIESFLGRIYDPADATFTETGLKVFSESSFRILMLMKTIDPVLLKHQLGAVKTAELLSQQNLIIRVSLQEYGGREVEHPGSAFIASFDSASKAVNCALAIVHEMKEAVGEATGFKMGIHAGEPVEKSEQLFGDTLRMADYIRSVAGNLQVGITQAIKQLVAKDFFQKKEPAVFSLSIQDENLLSGLCEQLETNWREPEFNLENYCQAMAMSQSQLYRKTIALTGLSPNLLLKDFRLEKAKELMQKEHYNVSQVTFESGFSSPSYFTKCFKKKYGLLPMTYLDLLQ
ncbi:MAG: nickel-binding protein [Ferruginibacter sp.]